jgi:hypothetical protein
MGTIHTVLHLAASRSWPVHQLDVKNAFLHDLLAERVCCLQLADFINETHLDHVCLLSKSLYGLKQAPQACYQWFTDEIQSIGFKPASSDTLLFIHKHGNDVAYLLLYVNNIVLTTSSPSLLQHVIGQLSSPFAIKDLGPLHFFFDIHVQCTESAFFLHQAKYAEDNLDRAGMINYKPLPTPVDTNPKALATAGAPTMDASFYRNIIDALQYLTLTCLNLTYAMHQVCLHMHCVHDTHWALIKCILCYIRGTTAHGMHIIGPTNLQIKASSDADWASCTDTRQSMLGYCVFIGDSLVSWSSK